MSGGDERKPSLCAGCGRTQEAAGSRGIFEERRARMKSRKNENAPVLCGWGQFAALGEFAFRRGQSDFARTVRQAGDGKERRPPTRWAAF